MTGISVKELWDKYLQGTATPAELEELKQYFGKPQYRAAFDGLLQDAFTDPNYIESGDYNVDDIVNNLMIKLKAESNNQPVVRRMRFKRRFWVAASVLIIAIAGAYLWNIDDKKSSPVITSVAAKEDLPPGTEGAILTLSDGSRVVLDSLGNGLVAHENGSDVMLENGKLLYDLKGEGKQSPAYNTMYTPRGRQFQLTLPDGSRVWLNAASSIRFPVAFTGPERKVEIIGEAYIEVKKNAARPFVVSGKGFELLVLGTSFNINSYADNGTVKATLVEGTIKLSHGTDSTGIQLRPGEQWVWSGQGATPDVIRSADISQVLAWKEKRFSFNGNIRSIMNEVARWYDVELKYEGRIPDKELEGGFTREKELQKVLQILEVASGVHFELKGKLLTIRASE